MFEQLPPRGAHEVRPARHLGTRIARVEQQRPADPLFSHFLEVPGDAFLAGRTVEPPPVAPRLELIRRHLERFGQLTVGSPFPLGCQRKARGQ